MLYYSPSQYVLMPIFHNCFPLYHVSNILPYMSEYYLLIYLKSFSYISCAFLVQIFYLLPFYSVYVYRLSHCLFLEVIS